LIYIHLSDIDIGMSNGESFPEGSAAFDFNLLAQELNTDKQEQELNNADLKKIFFNHCKRLIDEGRDTPELFWQTEQEFLLESQDQGNNIAILARAPDSNNNDYFVRLGYFWGGEFVIFPELIDPSDPHGELNSNEIKNIKSIAMDERTQYLKKIRDMRLDYGSPAVQGLHKEMSMNLSLDNINEILVKYCSECKQEAEYFANRISEDIRDLPKYNYDGPQLYADEFTNAAICLRGDRQKGGPYMEDSLITLMIPNSYVETPNYLKSRKPRPIFIDIARRDPIVYDYSALDPKKGVDWDEPDFEDSFHIIDDLIPKEDLDDYIELAQKVRDVAEDFKSVGLNFDKKHLGVMIPPPSIDERWA
jgi:hypothetical protein